MPNSGKPEFGGERERAEFAALPAFMQRESLNNADFRASLAPIT